jgi:diadenosine tetraphosphate (Ap4A) HIT family hydrolase
MLVRWLTTEDIPLWETLSKEYDQYIYEIATDFSKWYQGFHDYMNRKINQHEAVIAVDRMSGRCNGAVAFSRSYNRITFFAISPLTNHKTTANKLITVAMRQLDTNSNITVNLPVGGNEHLELDRCVFLENGFSYVEEVDIDGCPMHKLERRADNQKRGGSFHYRYPEFIKESTKENCPPCNHEPMPDGQIDILLTDKICVGGEYPGQGRLFGKLHVMPIDHYFHFEDMPEAEASFFMSEVQRVGRALRKITGAVKINYEMHANSGAHIHIHLFPRYLDDNFPSAPIDYRVSEPAPYESYEEYLWFVNRMREELSHK